MIIQELTEMYLPALERNSEWFTNLQEKLTRHMKNCYNVVDEIKTFVLEKDPENRFFNDEVLLTESKIVFCHFNGYLEKVDPEQLVHYRKDLRLGKYNNVEYIEEERLSDLLPNKLTRLDQLPRFQDILSEMPKELQ